MTIPRWRAVILGCCLVWSPATGVIGAELPRSDEATDYLSPQAMTESHPQWSADPKTGAAIGGFLVWPSVTFGAVMDSNPFQLHKPRDADVGLRVAPRFLAVHGNAVHETVLYGQADARLYPGDGRANSIDGRVGAIHDWAVHRDLMLRAQVDLSRHTDVLDDKQLRQGKHGNEPLHENDASASVSAQKTWSRGFVVLSGAALRSSFDDVQGPTARSSLRTSPETVLTLKSRVGYFLGPALYAFVEPVANWRMIDVLPASSTGTRVTTGLGSGQVGLFSGEVFAGRQQQTFPEHFRSVSTPVVGGRLSWFPTRAWTVSATFDRTLGDVAVGTIADRLGTPVKESSADVEIRYAIAARWGARADVSLLDVDYVGTRRRDLLTTLGCRLDYALLRSLDVSFEVRLTNLQSTIKLAEYRREPRRSARPTATDAANVRNEALARSSPCLIVFT